MGDISRNFSYSEFLVSEDYPELAAQMTLTESDKAKVKYMVLHWLQPLRDDSGARVQIQSGKRSYLLNSKVKGSMVSDHLFEKPYSCAADLMIHAWIVENRWKPSDIIDWFKAKGGFKQLLCYESRKFFHFAPWGLTFKENQVKFV